MESIVLFAVFSISTLAIFGVDVHLKRRKRG